MNIFVMSRHSGQIKESLPTGRAGVSSAPCARLRRGLASSRLRPAQRKRVRGFSRCPVGASASFACEAVGFGGFGGLGFGADGGALSGAGGVAGGGFGLNFAVNEGKTPDFHFSPFAPTVAACALKNSASIRRTSSLMGAQCLYLVNVHKKQTRLAATSFRIFSFAFLRRVGRGLGLSARAASPSAMATA